MKGKIFLSALIVGMVYILPHFLFIREVGRNYHLFFRMHGEEESKIYAARVREKYDGNYLSSDPYIYENKTKPYVRPFFAEFLVGTLGRMLGLSINNLFMLGDFIFPAIIFLLLFYFVNLLVLSPSLSLLGAMVIMLAELPDSLIALLKLSIPGGLLTFTRPISPQFVYIFFIACLIFIYKSLTNDKTINILLSGFFLGLLFYMYPYFWSYIFVGFALLFLYFIFKGEFKQIKIIFFILIQALVLSIPFCINYLQLMSLPFCNEIMARIGLQMTHRIIILKLPILVLIIFITFYRKRDFNFFFLLLFLLSGVLCFNQQVLTGRTVGPENWYFYICRQIAVIAMIVLLGNFLEKAKFRERFVRLFLIIGFTFSISMGIIIQIYNYENNKYTQHQQQYLSKAFVWLEENTKKEDVVLASNSVSLLIPIHTHNNIYWASYIFEYAILDKEIVERFFLLARLLGMKDDEVMDYILTYRKEGKGYSNFFGSRYEEPNYQPSNQKAKVKLPPNFYNYIKQRYHDFQKENLFILLKHFRIDYLFYGPDEKLLSKGRFKQGTFLDRVYDSADIQIYKIIR